MNNAKTYLPKVIITIILVFLLLGSIACLIAKNVALNPKTCDDIVDDKQLPFKVHSSLNTLFTEKYNATGIPADVYMQYVTEDWLDSTIKLSFNNGLGYLNGTLENYSFKPDYTALDNNITMFFENYANENGYSQDSTYTQRLQTEISTAHSIINNYVDVFKFDTLYNEGVLSQIKKPIKYLDTLTILCLAFSAVFVVILFLLNFKDKLYTLYWLGISFIISAVIIIIPCAYINGTNYFDAFVIKQEQIFIAFTTFMYNILDSVIFAGIAISIVGLAMILINALIKRKPLTT